VSIGGVLDSAIRLYRTTFSRCLPLAILAALCGIAFGVVQALNVPMDTVPSTDPAEAMRRVTAMMQTMFSPIMLAGYLLVALASLVFNGAIILTEKAIAAGDSSITFGRAVATSLRRLPAAVAASVLATLGMAIGFLLLVIPGLYLMGKWQLVITSIYMEDAGPLEAFGISWRLTRGRWWRGMAIITVAGVIAYLFIIAFGFLAGIGLALVSAGQQARMIATQVLTQIPVAVFLPLLLAVSIAMFHDFRLRAQGGDLEARANALRQA
jgi:hypothetical protein